LTEQTGQDEATLIAQALPLGLNLLYRQVAEQVFIAGTLPRENALTILGDEKVERLEYLQHAFPQDIEKVDSYQQGDTVAFVDHHEFKVILENQNIVEGIFDQIEIDINAFINTKGGIIYLGINENGKVQGIELNKQQQNLKNF
jgi:uncharacterized protein YuzE